LLAGLPALPATLLAVLLTSGLFSAWLLSL
jgi:hypothetical protein